MNVYRACFLCFLLLTGTFPPGVFANPANPSVRAGSASFSTSGSTSIIHQASDRVIINWDTFSIRQGETTRFIQPGSTSAALNRVTSGNPSEIYGNLKANGRVLLINPNGILVGPGGRIDTAGFLASTLDVSDSDFLGGGDMIFSGNSSAKVVNLGTINAMDGGDIFLIAQQVENYGTLNAPGGTVGLAGGTRVMVKSEAMGERISILPGSKGGSVTNGGSGTVTAAVAELKAAGGNEYSLAINNDGLVRASRFQSRGGKIYLGSGGGSRVRNRGTLRAPEVQIKAPTGTVENAGTIDASSEVGNGGEIEIEAESVIGTVGGFLNTTGLNDGGSINIAASGELRLDDTISATGQNGLGGTIRLTGDTVTLGDHASIDANGASGGGTILVGGGRAGRDASIANARNTTVEDGATLFANATGSVGDGGTVILWADDTMDYRGSVENRGAGSGAGGFTEVSGLRSLGFHGTVDTGGGDLLLDPFNYTIGAVEATAIVAALVANNVTIDTTVDNGAFGSSGNAADVGDIIVNSDIFYDSTNDLTFLAQGDINFNAAVQNRSGSVDAGDINIVAGWDGTTAYDTVTYSAVDVNAANATLFGNQNGGSTGSIFIGDGTQAAGIAVGTRRGVTNVFGHDVALQAGNSAGDGRFSQLGFQVTAGLTLDGTNLRPGLELDGRNVVVDGGITVHARNDLTATGGDTGQNNYAQLGHVGADLGGSSEIEASATATVEISTGNDIRFTGGDGVNAYAQLGQGGNDTAGDHDGATTITTTNDIVFSGGAGVNSYAQLGQGGSDALGDHTGSITITNANDIRFSAGGFLAYAQLGQGGIGALGNHSGTTMIGTVNDIVFTGGTGSDGYAQLGQGGSAADASVGMGHSGTTTITSANDIRFTGGAGNGAYAQLGQGGNVADGDHGGTTTITSANDVRFAGGDGPNAYAQLGQGGRFVQGDLGGTTTIAGANSLALVGGGGNAYAQIGNGGASARGDQSGTIMITSTGDISLTAGTATNAYVQIGSGGDNVDGDHGGNITVEGKNITLTGTAGTSRYAQIGNGGDDADGSHSGNITVTANGNLILNGDDTVNRYAIIGNGDDGDGTVDETVSGDVFVRVGGTATLTNAFIGNRVANAADYTSGRTYVGTGDTFTTDANSQLNSAAEANGGELRIYLEDASHDLVDSNTLLNGVAHGFAATPNDQGDFDFGLGPYNPGNSATGGAEVAGNFNYYVSAVAGFYNYIINGAEAAAIIAALNSGDVDINRNLNQAAFGAILDTDGGTQFITVNNDIFYGSIFDLAFLTTGDINFNASVQNRDGTANAGDINIVAGWDGSTAYDTATFSAVDVNAANATLFGNEGFVTDAMTTPTTGSVFIGDGTQTSGIAVGSRRGTTNVFGHDVALQAGNGDAPQADSYFSLLGFQITDGVALGNNDLRPMGDADGANVIVDGGITIHNRNDLTASGGGLNNYAQVGHVGADIASSFAGVGAGVEADEADASAVIEISTGNDIIFSGGGGNRAYAQLGQGGGFADGDHSGTTTITTASDITFSGGDGFFSYAQLGQGGADADGDHSGTTTITTANDIAFFAGFGAAAYVQLGQGGAVSDGNHSGTTTITTANDITFSGGSGIFASAQLGQGGAMPPATTAARRRSQPPTTLPSPLGMGPTPIANSVRGGSTPTATTAGTST